MLTEYGLHLSSDFQISVVRETVAVTSDRLFAVDGSYGVDKLSVVLRHQVGDCLSCV